MEVSTVVLSTDQEVTLRALTASDADSLLQFRKQVVKDSATEPHALQFVGQPYSSAVCYVKRLMGHGEDASLLVGAFKAGQLVGYVNLKAPLPEDPLGELVGQFGLMVLKECWGQGVGKKLLEALEAQAAQLGVVRLEATVRVTNERALRLFKHRGFQIEGVRKKAVRVAGELHDEYYVAKILNDLSAWTPPTLQTERLIIRPITPADAHSIFQYAQNPNVCQYTLWEKHISAQDSLDYIKDYVLDYYARGIPEPLGITLKIRPHEVIGTVGCFWASQEDKAMELAYALSEDYWGQGIAVEASQAVMDYCAQEFGLKRIQAQCKVANTASAKVMEKLGMSFEGTLKAAIFHRGQHWDMHYYAKVYGESS